MYDRERTKSIPLPGSAREVVVSRSCADASASARSPPSKLSAETGRYRTSTVRNRTVETGKSTGTSVRARWQAVELPLQMGELAQ